MMFGNSNQDIVKETANAVFRAHRLRNSMACIAIALTAMLIFVVCGAGYSTVAAIQKESSMNPGPGSGGAGIYGGFEQLAAAKQLPEVEWAVIARNCTAETPHNPEFAGMEVSLLGVEEEYYGHNYVELISGGFPESENELLLSDTMAEKLGENTAPGRKLTLNVIVVRAGEEVLEPIEFTVSGIYQNPLRSLANYEEIYTSAEFPARYNPELSDRQSKIFIKLKGITSASSDSDLEEALSRVNEAAGGYGICYVQKGDFLQELLGGLALALLVAACGYFLIYNIFYISAANDVKFMGTMKTIGMTGKQLKKMMSIQIRKLAVAGTAIGCAAGALLNWGVVSAVSGDHSLSYAMFYEAQPFSVPACLFAILFTAATVYISSRKALRIASKISPVRASVYQKRGYKKTVFAAVSFLLGAALFSILFTATLGYDVDYKVKRVNAADFTVKQMHSEQPMQSKYRPMDPGIEAEIRKLPYVEEVYTYYQVRPAIEESADEEFVIYGSSLGRIRLEGGMKEEIEAMFRGMEDLLTEAYTADNGDYMTGIVGMSPESLSIEEPEVEFWDGSFDIEKFATGDYVIYHPMFGGSSAWNNGGTPDGEEGGRAGTDSRTSDGYGGNDSGTQETGRRLRAGDTVTIPFYNYAEGKYVEKELTVMAVVSNKYDNYAGSFSSENQIFIPNSLFQEIYSDSARMISKIEYNVKQGSMEEYTNDAERMIQNLYNPQVELSSKYQTRQAEQSQKNTMTAIGIFAGLALGLIGLVNIINTQITDALARKLEFAAMQSIGMTKKQMRYLLARDGCVIIGSGFLLSIPVSLTATRAVTAPPASTGFSAGTYGTSLALSLAAALLTVWATAAVLTFVMNKKPVVERLRSE